LVYFFSLLFFFFFCPFEHLRPEKFLFSLHTGSQTLLTHYSRERVLENLPLMTAIDVLKRVLENQNELMVLARSFNLRALNSLGPLKGLIMKYAMKNGAF